MNSDDLLEESNRILSEMIALALQGERLLKMPVVKGFDEATYRAIYHELSNSREKEWRDGVLCKGVDGRTGFLRCLTSGAVGLWPDWVRWTL